MMVKMAFSSCIHPESEQEDGDREMERGKIMMVMTMTLVMVMALVMVMVMVMAIIAKDVNLRRRTGRERTKEEKERCLQAPPQGLPRSDV